MRNVQKYQPDRYRTTFNTNDSTFPLSQLIHIVQTSIISRIIIVTLLFAGLTQAQLKQTPLFSHPLTTERTPGIPKLNRISSVFPETTKILVAMVEFQQDNDVRTAGDGTFNDTIVTKKFIDSPPHNREYVQNHLQFASNYFKKVSDNKQFVAATILDSIYKLPHPMTYYSPLRNSTDNHELGILMQDVWSMVDSVSPEIDFSQYNAFMIFHAGVGRDVDLASLYGYDPTPFDIPSLYVTLQSLKKMFGDSYNGVPVDSNQHLIFNTMVIPETESRELPTISGTVSIPLGINGLIVASIGSHLGLPDLFDTKTGNSGIGRFGLMDGQSIFSWNGIFPPEPSAWEKYFLGWIDPITITSGEAIYSLPAVSLSSVADSIYKVPITAQEYFLVENRNRDANRDGVTVTMLLDGQTFTRTWDRDTIGLNAFVQDSLYGVITNVDEFDWSLPGGIDRYTKELYDGGILVWHIDESVINAMYATDAINADPKHRGVNVEEADGSEDIGQVYGLFTAGSGSESGTPFDFWFEGNQATVRQQPGGNAFTPTSHPDSRSYTLANSHIYLKDFSVRGPRMTVTIQVGDDQVKLLAGFPKYVNREFGKNSVTFTNSGGGPAIVIGSLARTPAYLTPGSGLDTSISQASLYAWHSDGSAFNGLFASGLVAQKLAIPPPYEFLGAPVVGYFDGDSFLDAALAEGNGAYPGIVAWSFIDEDNDSLGDPLFGLLPPLKPTTSLIGSDTLFAVGTLGNGITFLSKNGQAISNQILTPGDSTRIVGLSLLRNPDVVIAVSGNGVVGIVTPGGVVNKRNFARTMNSSVSTGLISSTIGKQIILASQDGTIYLVDSSLVTLPGFPVFIGGKILNSPALADIDGDGQKDIVIFSGNKIYAINATGAMLNHFPIVVSTAYDLPTSPIVADVDGNGTVDIVAVTREGLIVAYDKNGNMADGFPIQSGVNRGSTPAVFYIPSLCLSCIDIGLAVASDDGQVYAWRTGGLVTGPSAPPQQPWPQYLHDAQNTGLDESVPVGTPVTNNFFPASQAYNWPNPVGPEQGFKTHIRYYLGQSANVTIKIFDLAGDLVTELRGPGVGGFDNEVEWDVANIQSGIYFAHIEAQGPSASGNAIIKIAVVK